MSTELSKDLDHYEQVVERGMRSFIEAGQALLAIRDGKLYGDGHDSFDAYVESRFGFTKRRANQLISASQVVENLGTTVPEISLPVCERQVRALGSVAKTPKEQAKVWKEAVKASPKLEDGTPQVSASIIKRVATQTKGKSAAPKVDPVESSTILSDFRPATSHAANHQSIDDAMNRLMNFSSAVVESASAVREAMENLAKLRDGFENRIAGYRKNHLDGLDVQASALSKCSSELRAAWLATKHGMSDSDCPRPVETLKRA